MSKGTKNVFNELKVGDKIRFKKFGIGSGRKVREGEVVETDLEHPMHNWAFRMYRVETETGWARVDANDTVGAEAHPLQGWV
jgi:hypothetical protein